MEIIRMLGAILVLGFVTVRVNGQGYGLPLTTQGVDHMTNPSAASRSAGGISVGIRNDISLMFTNPASLQASEGLHFSIGGLRQNRDIEQRQQWLPLRTLPTFSLLMEGLIDQIDDPDLSDPPPEGLGPEDSIPRPYDLIKPHWSRTERETLPIQLFAAAPFEFAGFRFVAGIGAVEYANVNHYFQNNNVLSPSIGSQRPFGIPLPAIGQELPVRWTQYSQSREGSIMGYGAAISVGLFEGLTVGMSGLMLSGSSDDYETTVARGLLRFGNNNNVYYFVLDSVYAREFREGTSDFSGQEYTVSSVYRGRSVTVSLAVKTPTKIFRQGQSVVTVDTTGGPTRSTIKIRDRIALPWRGTLGLALTVHENLLIGFECEIRPYGSAEYRVGKQLSNPWTSSSVFRAGIEYTPESWLALRAGYREQAEVFEEEGNALLGEPVRYSVYSAGFGLSYSDVCLNVCYEYSLVKYQDLWQTNVNLNRLKQQNILATVSYVLR